MTDFGKLKDRDAGSLARAAAARALADAAVESTLVQMIFFSNACAGRLIGQEMIRGQVMLGSSGLEGIPLINVENACASGSSALFLAWLAVASGQCDIALAVGAEKLAVVDKKRTFEALMGGVDVSRIDELRAKLGLGESEDRAHSLFMDVYAAMATSYMGRTGATKRDFALVSAKNHCNGALNPHAQYRHEVSVDEVLASRQISGPLTLLMCAPIGDGAAAAVVCSRSAVRSCRRDLVQVRGFGLATGREDANASPVEKAARVAYEQSGIGPEEIDVIELHDATAPAELIIYEELGLCGPGEGPRLLASGATALGGRVPVNPSGGLLSKGHPIGATGIAQIVELVEQLRHQAGRRQVENAQIALAENAGGYLHPHPAAAAVTILSR
jgi:acetyl-CoA acetyltransferase